MSSVVLASGFRVEVVVDGKEVPPFAAIELIDPNSSLRERIPLDGNEFRLPEKWDQLTEITLRVLIDGRLIDHSQLTRGHLDGGTLVFGIDRRPFDSENLVGVPAEAIAKELWVINFRGRGDGFQWITAVPKSDVKRSKKAARQAVRDYRKHPLKYSPSYELDLSR